MLAKDGNIERYEANLFTFDDAKEWLEKLLVEKYKLEIINAHIKEEMNENEILEEDLSTIKIEVN